jgi:uncharacterized membrane protein
MDPQVIAAWIAAAAATVAAVISGFVAWRVSALSGQVQAETQLVNAALDHLIGGSQKRAAGLAAYVRSNRRLKRSAGIKIMNRPYEAC